MKKKLLRIVLKSTANLLIIGTLMYCLSNFALAHETKAQHMGETQIELSTTKMELRQFFSQVEAQSTFRFHYNAVLSEVKTVVSLNGSADLETLLYEVAKQTDLSFKQVNEDIAVRKLKKTNQNKAVVIDINISGTVIDADTGEPIVGASVFIEGSGIGIATDLDGNWTLDIPEELMGKTITASYLGYQSATATIGQRPINFSLKSNELDEVVVVGYGTQKKINLTGAVDNVTGEVFENRPVPNIAQGLQGAIPNLNINIQDGKPTQSPSFNIRGTTSIGQGGNALVLIDGVEGDPSMINPSDIESISVLKDASASSIYGARGAFGVILITTKSPSKDKMSLSYTTNWSIKSPTVVPDLVTDGYTWASMFNEAWTAWNDYSQTPQNANKTLPFSQDYLAELKRRSEDPSLPDIEVGPNGEYIYYGSTDYYGELYKKSLLAMEHNLSLSGSNGKTGYYITGRYFDQEGLFRYNSDDFKMYNFRAKGSLEMTDWLTVENNTEYSFRQYHNPLNVGEGGSIWRNIADEGHPVAPMLNPDGTLSYSAAYTIGDYYYGKNGIDTERSIIKNITSFNSQFFDNTFRVRGNFTFQDIQNNEQRIRVPVPYSRSEGVIEYVGTNTNDIRNQRAETRYMATNLYAEYEPKLQGLHSVKGLVGYNFETSTYSSLTAQRNGLIFEDAQDINLALGQSITTNGGWDRWDIQGGFFRVNYNYAGKYLLEVNGRYDGSSKFPEDQRYAFFPSFSAGWRVSDESFFNISETAISDLKIRGSYGSLGNGNINSYAFQELFSITQSDRVLNGVKPQYTNQPGVLPDGLTWETSTTANIGIDLGMLSNRLTFTGDAYIRNTTDMFTVGKSLPAVFGTAVPKGNYADLRTKGWEFVLAWRDQVSVASKPLNYSVKFFMADYNSTITKYNNENKQLTDYYEGMKVGEIWGYVTEGLFESMEDISSHADQSYIQSSTSRTTLPGDIKFQDLNNDGVINKGLNTVDNPGDQKIIGNSTPRYTYGFNIDLSYQNFFLNTFFQGVGKRDWWPGGEAGLFWGQYNRPYNDVPKSMLGNIWSEDNPDAYFPRYRGYTSIGSNRSLSSVQTRYLQSIAYLRMKNIQIGYNLPKHIASKYKMGAARLYLSGENLLTWSPLYKVTKNLDVENTGPSDLVLTSGTSGNGNNYPILKSVTLGLSITF
ncbi:SusC/RagA family TonB-linked outer membrane protein [Echinicola rosea]|uniref:SusC/RagA family TonB-linked outer membrane protein n=1 Tax=Echinicola rosea TaxID=1807691 RepID=A0ABQ1V990_9BACT|nr:TonB-dependent receptor [Echinicola rosea]GGF45725.1 SusC/RagA family TonB-linked outer membrane protein [Echinicola rosea]